MKRGLDWYRREPIAFINGVKKLGIEGIAAYTILLDLIYARGGDIERDDHELAGILKCSKRKATKLTNDLVSVGKLTENGEFLSNNRANLEIKHQKSLHEKRSKGGRKRAEKLSSTNKNNDLEGAPPHGPPHGPEGAPPRGPARAQLVVNREDKIRKEEIDSSMLNTELNPEKESSIETLADRAEKSADPPVADYAYEGHTIKLRHKDFDEWTRAFPELELLAELVSRDAWYRDRATAADRGRWFMATSAHLKNRNRDERNLRLERERQNKDRSRKKRNTLGDPWAMVD